MEIALEINSREFSFILNNHNGNYVYARVYQSGEVSKVWVRVQYARITPPFSSVNYILPSGLFGLDEQYATQVAASCVERFLKDGGMSADEHYDMEDRYIVDFKKWKEEYDAKGTE